MTLEQELRSMLASIANRRRPMTMPHLMNCSHRDDGWCSECVMAQGNELLDLQSKWQRVFKIHVPDGTPCGYEQAGGPSCVKDEHHRPVTYDDWQKRGQPVEELMKSITASHMAQSKYCVVVVKTGTGAQNPNSPTMAYVLPTGKLSEITLNEFREAAEKGGCAVRMFTGLGPSGIEHVKHELLTFSSTKLD